MKRWITALLLFALCMQCFVGCGKRKGESKENSPTVFSAGFAKADITPEESMPLDGYDGVNESEYRWSNSVISSLYATCTALSDGEGNTVLFITLDMLLATMADAMSKAISEATGIPISHVLIHCTHTHSSVDINVPDPAVMSYLERLMTDVVEAAKAALADRKPVTNIETGFARTEHCNSVRHYLLTNGEYIAYTAAKLPSDATWYGYTSQSDNLLQVVKFSREGGKSIVLVNWQAHPCANVDKKAITADYPGVLREELEAKLDCHAVYVQGGAGNLMTETELSSQKLLFERDFRELGEVLAESATQALANGRNTAITSIYTAEKEMELEDKYGNPRKITLSCFSIGDFAFVTAPFEIFDINAMAVKETSPFVMTFYASCCGGSNGYLPTPESFDWTQAYEARISSFPKGTAEMVEAAQRQLLSDNFAETGRSIAQKLEGYVRQPWEPQSDGKTYYTFLASTADFRPVKNGFYTFEAMDHKGNKVLLLLKDLAVAEEIIKNPVATYLFDQQNVVVGLIPGQSETES